jgi:hypothetical protein
VLLLTCASDGLHFRIAREMPPQAECPAELSSKAGAMTTRASTAASAHRCRTAGDHGVECGSGRPALGRPGSGPRRTAAFGCGGHSAPRVVHGWFAHRGQIGASTPRLLRLTVRQVQEGLGHVHRASTLSTYVRHLARQLDAAGRHGRGCARRPEGFGRTSASRPRLRRSRQAIAGLVGQTVAYDGALGPESGGLVAPSTSPRGGSAGDARWKLADWLSTPGGCGYRDTQRRPIVVA